MSEYRKLIECAVKKGAGEKAMWKAVEVTDELIESMKADHPEEYDRYLREMYEVVYGKHYNEEMAIKEVEKMFHTDAQGVKHQGQHWTVEQIEAATAGRPFPAETTKWDKYVAYNAAWHDFARKFSDEQVLQIAYLFYFQDEDFDGDSKVWKYMSLK